MAKKQNPNLHQPSVDNTTVPPTNRLNSKAYTVEEVIKMLEKDELTGKYLNGSEVTFHSQDKPELKWLNFSKALINDITELNTKIKDACEVNFNKVNEWMSDNSCEPKGFPFAACNTMTEEQCNIYEITIQTEWMSENAFMMAWNDFFHILRKNNTVPSVSNFKKWLLDK